MREPSAPKKNSPSPTSARCSATDTISRISTVASASGRYASRYSSGPMGVTSSSTASERSSMACGLSTSSISAASSGSSTAQNSVLRQSTSAPRDWRTSSTISTSAASPSSIHSSGGD